MVDFRRLIIDLCTEEAKFSQLRDKRKRDSATWGLRILIGPERIPLHPLKPTHLHLILLTLASSPLHNHSIQKHPGVSTSLIKLKVSPLLGLCYYLHANLISSNYRQRFWLNVFNKAERKWETRTSVYFICFGILVNDAAAAYICIQCVSE